MATPPPAVSADAATTSHLVLAPEATVDVTEQTATEQTTAGQTALAHSPAATEPVVATRPVLRIVTDDTSVAEASTTADTSNTAASPEHATSTVDQAQHQAQQPSTAPSASPTYRDALRKGVKTVASPVGLAGIAVETAWNAAHAALYPFGLVNRRSRPTSGYSTDRLSPEQRAMVVGNVEAAETPIVLIHGMIDNRSIFTRLQKHLTKNGFSRVSTVNYSPFTTDLRNAARVLADHIAEVVEETGCERIHVVGHSLGGLIARYYVQKMGGDRHVDTLVTLGTPHQGTLAAHAWVGSLVKQLRPGSDLLAELESTEAGEPACQTKFVCYWSDLDHLVLPSRHGRITQPGLQVKNILVRGVGHMTLPVQARVVRDVCQTLGQLQQPGESLPEHLDSTVAIDNEHIAEAS